MLVAVLAWTDCLIFILYDRLINCLIYMYRIEYRYKSPKFCLRFFPLNKVKKKYFIFLLDVKKESTLTGHGFSNSLYCTTSPISHIKCGHQ